MRLATRALKGHKLSCVDWYIKKDTQGQHEVAVKHISSARDRSLENRVALKWPRNKHDTERGQKGGIKE